MKLKTINKIIPAQKVNMGGHYLDQPLPSQEIESIDPFLLIHHWIDTMPGGQRQREVGVGPHPHRGFSPVTFVFKGDVEHRDSLENRAIVEAGGTQWMFAGKGITHSERPSGKLAENGGEIEFIQFWVNAPSKNKMEPAFYKPISEDETPYVKNEGSLIKIVCGEYEGIKGAVSYFTNLTLLRIDLDKSAHLNFKLEESFNNIIYQLDGELSINGSMTHGKDMIWFEKNGDTIEIGMGLQQPPKQNRRDILRYWPHAPP